jgi:hypothetical protein
MVTFQGYKDKLDCHPAQGRHPWQGDVLQLEIHVGYQNISPIRLSPWCGSLQSCSQCTYRPGEPKHPKPSKMVNGIPQWKYVDIECYDWEMDYDLVKSWMDLVLILIYGEQLHLRWGDNDQHSVGVTCTWLSSYDMQWNVTLHTMAKWSNSGMITLFAH